jgi:cation diffusion facilitator CzcD-associated flavoprotein CzcO
MEIMREHTVIVVGTGFSGLCAGILLQKAGIHSFTILEKADRIGGTWRENTYPGAACDVPSHLYSYSFEPNPSWSRSYGGQAEILAYLEHCVDKYRLAPHIELETEVTGATFDEASGTWAVTVRRGGGRGDGGDGAGTGRTETLRARALILGNGALHLPAFPDIPGLDRFAGKSFHSARWDHGYDLAGKTVAVIGTGASAIQFVPEIAPKVKRLHLFQRTPPWVVPKADRLMTARERWLFRRLPGAHWARRAGLYWKLETRAVPLVYEPRIAKFGERFALRHLERSVPDPVLRAKLTPDYRLGCKRVLLSNDYYPALQRDNVEVVTDAIREIVPDGVITADGVLRKADALIIGTGFRVAEYLTPVRITGRGGRDLNDAWRRGPATYLGINVAGFPNLFLLFGPNTGLGHNSMIFMIEAQTRYAVQAIQALEQKHLAYLDVRPDVQDAFAAELAAKLGKTVWATGCSSWYKTADGALVLWPGFTFDYWRRTRRIDLRRYHVARR